MGFTLLHSGQPSAKRLLKRLEMCKGTDSIQQVANDDIVIRWGNFQFEREFHLELNPRLAIANTQNRLHMLRMLQRSGIRCPIDSDSNTLKNPTMVRQYRVPIFDLKPLTCFRSDGKDIWLNKRITQVQDSFQEVSPDHDAVTAKVCLYAARAIHTLGLDFGLVSIGTNARGWMYVLDVTPNPILKGRMLDVFSKAIRSYIADDAQAPNAYQSFLIGTDLEFMLRNQQGKMVLASKYFPRKGIVGCDARSIQRDGKRYPLAELRPAPEKKPLDLFENLYHAMMEAKRLINRKGVAWLAGSMPFHGYPIGGHIHFSGIPFSSQIAKALDTYLAIPVMLIEDPQSSTRRRPRYGFLGDIRHKDHGGFEYRTPGSWIVNPDIAKAVICLAYLVAQYHRQLAYNPFVDADVQQAFYASNKLYFRPIFERVWSELSQLPNFGDYKQQLQIIADMVRQEECWNESEDIKRNWRISSAVPTSITNANRKSLARRLG
ncbi:hypothetical protein LSG31_16215 [Fodinisporobacter ferrooxydans]|uniref:Phage phiEco32-like COOH-NH2 ligase-type 2 n=1 Tax=Fodinisporobacter ferrooxydans TaxID=2901836 RepID=A0ABY4CJ18_9BACL|nr:hypothetical protein LSG31_16215 [Alicyclobacillaceae bacterium MYW30-H2]